MVYDTEDPTLIAKMNHEMREIESMEIVGVLSYTAAGQYPAGFGVTLRYRASRNEGACGKKGEGPVRLNLTSCGFSALWYPVRKTLVYDAPAGKLRPEVSKVWLSRIKWDRIKTGGDGSQVEDDLRQQREGTLIEFLDEACTAYSNFTPHSFHIEQAKMAERSSSWDLEGGKITRGRDFTMEIKLSSSRGG